VPITIGKQHVLKAPRTRSSLCCPTTWLTLRGQGKAHIRGDAAVAAAGPGGHQAEVPELGYSERHIKAQSAGEKSRRHTRTHAHKNTLLPAR